jgi:5-(hydroxymethyl)furfural/furfural oxidase
MQGLRVVDASIFPVLPCANTNLPTLMTAEKIAGAMQRTARRTKTSRSG